MPPFSFRHFAAAMRTRRYGSLMRRPDTIRAPCRHERRREDAVAMPPLSPRDCSNVRGRRAAAAASVELPSADAVTAYDLFYDFAVVMHIFMPLPAEACAHGVDGAAARARSAAVPRDVC